MAQDSSSEQLERGHAEPFGVGLEREVIRTDRAPVPVGPYSQAIRVDNSVFTAGQIGLDPATGKLVDGGIQPQTRQVLQNLSAVLEVCGDIPRTRGENDRVPVRSR